MEPHLTRFEGLDLLERRSVREVIRENKAESGLEGFCMQYDALDHILKRINSRKKIGGKDYESR